MLGHEIQISFIRHLYCLHLYSRQAPQNMWHHTGSRGILKVGLKLVTGYFQFGSDYLGEGEWQGNSLLPVIQMATNRTVQMNILAEATLNLQSLMTQGNVLKSEGNPTYEWLCSFYAIFYFCCDLRGILKISVCGPELTSQKSCFSLRASIFHFNFFSCSWGKKSWFQSFQKIIFGLLPSEY